MIRNGSEDLGVFLEPEKIVRLVPDRDDPGDGFAIELFIDGKWETLTTGDRDDMEEMHCDLCMAIEQYLAERANTITVTSDAN